MQDELIQHYLLQNTLLKLRKFLLGLEAYLGAPKNKIYQESTGFFKLKFFWYFLYFKGAAIRIW